MEIQMFARVYRIWAQQADAQGRNIAQLGLSGNLAKQTTAGRYTAAAAGHGAAVGCQGGLRHRCLSFRGKSQFEVGNLG